MTRIVVPVVSPEGLASQVNDHFAMSDSFVVLDVKGGRIASVEAFPNAQPGEKKAAELVVEHGAKVVLAGRIGSCMTRIFMDRGVEVFSGAGGTVKKAFQDYKKGRLTEVRPNPYQI